MPGLFSVLIWSESKLLDCIAILISTVTENQTVPLRDCLIPGRILCRNFISQDSPVGEPMPSKIRKEEFGRRSLMAHRQIPSVSDERRMKRDSSWMMSYQRQHKSCHESSFVHFDEQ